MNLDRSTALRVTLAIALLLLATFLLLFGVANLLHPDVPAAYLTQNTVISSALSAVGLLALAAAGFLLRRRQGAQVAS